jgi:hypothetical protein
LMMNSIIILHLDDFLYDVYRLYHLAFDENQNHHSWHL